MHDAPGSENWHLGFNYSDWAFQNAPFYFNDTLVFKYDPPSNTTFPHSVYLFPDRWSYLNCNLKRAKMIANATQGGGNGFEFALKRWRPYYFACCERNGFHCKVGGMRFMVVEWCHSSVGITKHLEIITKETSNILFTIHSVFFFTFVEKINV
ncbi:hypothetical protein HRI_002033400 [Hibiscus trionum]|nr:hypothetical protein HRI_002033400 [Hibiscus trionum]